jgi:hypothetical protein
MNAQRALRPWQHGHPYWTRERMIEALREYMRRTRGRLPGNRRAWQRVKSGDLTLPGTKALLAAFPTFEVMWRAAGAGRSRMPVKRKIPFTADEDDYILSNYGGRLRVDEIAARLRRTPSAIQRRARVLGIRANGNLGYLTAVEVARQYNCPRIRVLALLHSGALRATKVTTGWAIDPPDLAAVEDELRKPKITHRGDPPELGDWRERYGVKRRAATEEEKELRRERDAERLRRIVGTT